MNEESAADADKQLTTHAYAFVTKGTSEAERVVHLVFIHFEPGAFERRRREPRREERKDNHAHGCHEQEMGGLPVLRLMWLRR